MDLLMYGSAAALIALASQARWHLAHRRHQSLTAVVTFAVSLLESRRTVPT